MTDLPLRRRSARTLALSACLAPMSLALAAAPADASTRLEETSAASVPSPPAARVQTAPPPGFEGLSDEIDTLFDVTVQGRATGSFRAVLSNGFITFAEPEAVAASLDGVIRREAVLALLSSPLDLNEQYRCFSGQTLGCGLLPPGMSGAIVDPQRFSVELFFLAADTVIEQRPALTLGRSSSEGLTLVQNVGLSFATADFFGEALEYGGAFDTFISLGQSAFIAQTLVSSGDGGSRLNQAHGQHIWSDRILRGGLIENFNASLLTNYRMVGSDFGVFTSPFEGDEQFSASPLDVVLPRDADVEIRRNGVLLSVKRYGAGPQRLDTSMLPTGAYAVAITARADGVVVVDEIRSFSKAGGLPPAGKTDFTVGVGLYVPDQRFDGSLKEQFLPEVETDALILSGRVARRIGATSAAEFTLLAVDSQTFGELSVRSIFSRFEGIAAVAAGSDGSHGASLTGNLTFGDARLSLTARSIRMDAPLIGAPASASRYRAFVRPEDSFLASAQFLVSGGSLNLSASYSQVEGFEDRYSAALRYNRPLEIAGRRALLNTYAQTTEQDTRVGFTLTFGFGVGSRTNGTASLGLEQTSTDSESLRAGLSPVANVSVSRRDEWRDFNFTSQAGLSTNADNDRIYASTLVASRIATGEITAQHISTRSGDFSTVYGSVQSGFAIGGGAAQFGMARPGEAVIIAEIQADTSDRLIDPASGYRVRVDSQPADLLRPGARTAVGLPAYADYELTLTPENAPPFDADLSIRRVTLYPGNVVRLKFDAKREYTLFGRLVGPDGSPLEGVLMRSGGDLTATDSFGYFTITALGDGRIEFRPTESVACAPLDVSSLIGAQNETLAFHRLGDVECRTADPSGR